MYEETRCLCFERWWHKKQEIEPERQNQQALTDEQILQLERMAEELKNIFGQPPGHRMVFG
jgi:phosphoenolpyruvate synthase/pyruvate phosphate dikinase